MFCYHIYFIGLLLRQMSTDSLLSQYSVIVIDEVSQRHISTYTHMYIVYITMCKTCYAFVVTIYSCRHFMLGGGTMGLSLQDFRSLTEGPLLTMLM